MAAERGVTRLRGVMIIWNLKELRDQIFVKKGERKDLIELVNAVGDSINVFKYHLVTARDSLKPFAQSEDATDLRHFEYVFGAADNQNEYEWAKLTNQSNVIAAIYTTRSLFDIFSQLVRGCLLESNISIEKCNIHVVRDHLRPGDLRSCLDALLNSNGFKYINDFSNISKHRSMISFGASINLVENRAGVQFKSFKYGSRHHPKMWSHDVLELVLQTKNTIINAGNALNEEIFNTAV